MRPRFTGRAAVLVLVIAVLMVSYASSLRAYLQQRDQLAALRSQIARSQADITALSQEKKRWKDPAYVRAQARARFGWVVPGEVGLKVLDDNGTVLGSHSSTLNDPSNTTGALGRTWYESTWASVVAAGTPRSAKDTPQPVTKIRPPASPKK